MGHPAYTYSMLIYLFVMGLKANVDGLTRYCLDVSLYGMGNHFILAWTDL